MIRQMTETKNHSAVSSSVPDARFYVSFACRYVDRHSEVSENENGDTKREESWNAKRGIARK